MGNNSTEIRGFRGDYEFLSNFYPCKIRYMELLFQSVEAAFQAAKSTDRSQSILFQRCSASEAKRMGKRIKLRPDWEQVKIPIMSELIKQKFSQDPDLKVALLATGDALLVEENTWHDNFYGDCVCTRCKTIHGQNMLGRLLMETRKLL